MKFTIITVTYNSASTLRETIESVIGQEHPDIEYIIVDGGSTDGTLSIINEYGKRISKIVSEKDNGLYDAMNKGIRLASGEVIGFLHSDDLLINSSVISHYNTLFEKGAEAVYSDLFYVAKDDTSRIIRKWKSGPFTATSFRNGWMPPHPTFYVLRSLYEKHGVYDTSFRTAADYELMLRMIERNGVKPGYLPEYTVKMRMGGASNATWKHRINANLEDRRAWKINGLKPAFYTLWLKPVRKIKQFF